MIIHEGDSNNLYTINLSKLMINNNKLINADIIKLVVDKNIHLELNTYDSDQDNKTRPTLVLIHGNSASKKAFAEQISHFSTAYRIIAIDLLGHGDSCKICNLKNLSDEQKKSLSEALYNPAAMIAEVLQLLESKSVKNAHFIGWSLGGHIAYGVAIANKNLVSSIITIGSPPVLFSAFGFQKGFEPWFINTMVPQWINEPKQYQMKEAVAIAQHIGYKQEDTFFANDVMAADPQMRRHLFLKLKSYDNPKYVGSVLDGEKFVNETDMPICLIVGENDGGINPDYIKSFEGKLKNPLSAVKVVAGASHAVFRTHPEKYFNITDRFLAGCKFDYPTQSR